MNDWTAADSKYEAEIAARDKSIEDPTSIYYVDYGTMEGSSDKIWKNGRSYDYSRAKQISNKLVGRSVTIINRDHMYYGEWGTIVDYNDDYYYVALWNGDDELAFSRDEFRVNRAIGESEDELFKYVHHAIDHFASQITINTEDEQKVRNYLDKKRVFICD